MIDSVSFRQLMGSFTTGICVVTLKDGELGEVGLTVNSVTSVSLTPPLVLFCLDKDAHLYRAFRHAQRFAINILADGQEPVSRHFADRHHNKKPERLWDLPQLGCPVLRNTLGWMVCEKVAAHKGGDHTIFVGEVKTLHKRSGQRDPLLYFHGRYRQIKPLV